MKKTTIKLDFLLVCQFDHWLEVAISEQLKLQLSYIERCATAVLAEWRIKKVHMLTLMHTNKPISIKADTAVSMALMDLIQSYRLPVTDSLGNWLLKVSRDIDQQFN